MRPLPIAIVLNTFEAGGTEHQMSELICRLDRDRFEVHVACFGNRGPLRERLLSARIPIAEFRIHGLARPRTALQMARFARWCRRHRIVLVQACDFYANVFALPAATLAGVPVRIGSRRDVFIPERTDNQARLQRLAYRCAHRIVTNSSAASQALVQEGIDPERIVRIENGLDLTRFLPAVSHSPARVVTTVANLRPGKGHDVLLKAARLVVDRGRDVRFDIVGNGPLRAELEALASTLGVASHVRFLGHCPDIASALRNTDVFAFPSAMEASPNAVLEAMAAGLPVVATAAGGIPEVVGHEHNGLLVPAGDEQALASAILRLLEDRRLAESLGASARRTVHSRFAFERMVNAFSALYAEEVSRRMKYAIRRPATIKT